MNISTKTDYQRALSRISSIACLRVQVIRMACCYARCPGQGPEGALAAAGEKLLGSFPELELTVGSPQQYLLQRARWSLFSGIEQSLRQPCGPDPAGRADPECPQMQAAVRSYGLSLFLAGLGPRERLVLALALGGLTAEQIGTIVGRRAERVDAMLGSVTGLHREWQISSAPRAQQTTRTSRARRLARRALRSKEDSETRNNTASLKGGG